MIGRNRKLPLLVVALVVCSSASAVEWQTDWKAAFATARAESKLVMVDFFADWCQPCLAMEKDVFPSAEVQTRLSDFVLLRVEYDRSKHRKFTNGIPAYIFFDAKERPLYEIRGFHRVEQFVAKLDPIRLVSRGADKTAARAEWPADWNGTFAKARAEQRLVFVHIGSKACQTCERMEIETYPNPVVVSALEPFLLLRVDADTTSRLGKYSIGSFRGLIVFDPTEEPRIRLAGYQTAEQFVRWTHLVRGAKGPLLKASHRLADGDLVEGNMLLGRAYVLAHVWDGARTAFAAAETAAAQKGDARAEHLAGIESAVSWREQNPDRALKLLREMDESPIREVEFARQAAFVQILMKLNRPKDAKSAMRRALANCPEEMRSDCDEHLQSMDRVQMPFPWGDHGRRPR